MFMHHLESQTSVTHPVFAYTNPLISCGIPAGQATENVNHPDSVSAVLWGLWSIIVAVIGTISTEYFKIQSEEQINLREIFTLTTSKKIVIAFGQGTSAWLNIAFFKIWSRFVRTPDRSLECTFWVYFLEGSLRNFQDFILRFSEVFFFVRGTRKLNTCAFLFIYWLSSIGNGSADDPEVRFEGPIILCSLNWNYIR